MCFEGQTCDLLAQRVGALKRLLRANATQKPERIS